MAPPTFPALDASYSDMGGEECMSAAFKIALAGTGERVATVDLRDFGQRNCKAPVLSQITAGARWAALFAAAPGLFALAECLAGDDFAALRKMCKDGSDVADMLDVVMIPARELIKLDLDKVTKGE